MATKKNIPEIRFKGFEGEWNILKMQEFGIATGGTSIETEFCVNGKFKVISIGSYSEQSTYTEQGLRANLTEKTKVRVMNQGDLAMVLNDKTASGRILGRVLLIEANDSYIYNQRTQRIEPDTNNFSSIFLYQLLNAPLIRQKIVFQSQGNTQIYVNWSAIKNTTYNTPLLPEQTQIGTYFQHLDSLISLHQRKYDKLLTLKKAMLEKMFPREGADVPEIRFKGFEGKWKKKTLGVDIADIIGGGTPSTFEQSYWNGNIDWYSPTEIGKNVYAFGSEKKITELGMKNCSAKFLPADKTILFTSRAGIGDMAILKRIGTTNQGFQSLVIKENYNTYFIYSMGHLIKKYALKNSSGSTFLEISGKVLGKMILYVPSFEEQTQIGTYFQNLDTLTSQHQKQLEKLKNVKKACLEKMFV